MCALCVWSIRAEDHARIYSCIPLTKFYMGGLKRYRSHCLTYKMGHKSDPGVFRSVNYFPSSVGKLFQNVIRNRLDHRLQTLKGVRQF